MNYEQLVNIQIGGLAQTGLALFAIILGMIALLGAGVYAAHKSKRALATGVSVLVVGLMLVGVVFSTSAKPASALSVGSSADVINLAGDKGVEALAEHNLAVDHDNPNGYSLYARTVGIDNAQVKVSVNDVVLGEEAVAVHKTAEINTDANFHVAVKASGSVDYSVQGKIIYTVVENTPDMSQYYNQDVNWTLCDDTDPDITLNATVDNHENYECTYVQAPVNWYDQNSEQISLAVVRYKATDPDKIGSLLMNPGGPGGSGIDTMAFGQATSGFVDPRSSSNITMDTQSYGLEKYDFTSWDPRGVGRSTQLVCDTSGINIADFPPLAPTTLDEGRQKSANYMEAKANACLSGTPVASLPYYMDTVTQAHDLDLMRALTNDDRNAKLNYIGFSWGTMLGAAYTGLFPDKVGRITLDGIVPFNDGKVSKSATTSYVSAQAIAHEQKNVIDDFLVHCTTEAVMATDCPFNTVSGTPEYASTTLAWDDIANLRTKFNALLTGEALEHVSNINTAWETIHANWNDRKQPFLANYLKQIYDGLSTVPFSATPSSVTSMSDEFPEPLELATPQLDILPFANQPDTSDRMNNLFTSCQDHQMTKEEDALLDTELESIYADMPMVGQLVQNNTYTSYKCQGLPVGRTPEPNYNNIDLPTILLVHSAYDLNTPPELTNLVLSQFSHFNVLVYDGAYHCAYDDSDDLFNHINKFFMTGLMPTNFTHYARSAYVAYTPTP